LRDSAFNDSAFNDSAFSDSAFSDSAFSDSAFDEVACCSRVSRSGISSQPAIEMAAARARLVVRTASCRVNRPVAQVHDP
jgi:hypothetical protein